MDQKPANLQEHHLRKSVSQGSLNANPPPIIRNIQAPQVESAIDDDDISSSDEDHQNNSQILERMGKILVAPKFQNLDHQSIGSSQNNTPNKQYRRLRQMDTKYKAQYLQASLEEDPDDVVARMHDDNRRVTDPNRCQVITVLCLINLFANSAYSSIAPFYPYEAVKKGLPTETHGFIFAGYSLSMFIFAPLFGILLNKMGRKNVLILGCFMESIAMFCFGLFDYISDPITYGICSFLCRVVEGFGNGCLNSATSSIISFNYADNMGNLIGLTQTFTGLGMLSGPIFGSILYEAGGFKLPFIVTGALLFILIFPISCLIQNDKITPQDQDQALQPLEYGDEAINNDVDYEQANQQHMDQAEPRSHHYKKVTFMSVLCQFKIFSTALCMSTSLMCLTFKEPLLQLRLKQENFKVWLIGIIFSMDTITYTLTSSILNFLPESRKNFQKLVGFGCLFFLFAMLIGGPVPLLPNKVYIICIGILIGGIGGALINNNCVPALNQILADQIEQFSIEQTNHLKNYLSAISTGAFGLGSILGPILASILGTAFDFRWAFTLCGGLVLIVAVVQTIAIFYKNGRRNASENQVSPIKLGQLQKMNSDHIQSLDGVRQVESSWSELAVSNEGEVAEQLRNTLMSNKTRQTFETEKRQ